MNETQDILQGTIGELEGREETLTEEIERVQVAAKAELRDVRKALTSLRKQLNGAASNGHEAPPGEITNDTKDAVMRELEGKSGRVSGIASAAHLHPESVRGALEQLQESGDVEPYGKGLWKVAE